MKQRKINVIVGPTASGKSSFAMQLAKEYNGQIINADAFQVYKDLRILTARPTVNDEKKIKHFLYGYADAYTQENVLGWLKKVKEVISELSYPIVVGGTGMYINALINGINEMPEIPKEIRSKVRQMDLQEIKSLLKEQHTVFSDPQRQKRALEVLLATGKPISYFHEKPVKKIVKGDFYITLIQPERTTLYQNIEIRLKEMMKAGVVEEVKKLKKLQPSGGVVKAIGVEDIMNYLQGNFSKKELQEQILLKTRHYAKRQMTWFRHQINPDVIIL